MCSYPQLKLNYIYVTKFFFNIYLSAGKHVVKAISKTYLNLLDDDMDDCVSETLFHSGLEPNTADLHNQLSSKRIDHPHPWKENNRCLRDAITEKTQEEVQSGKGTSAAHQDTRPIVISKTRLDSSGSNVAAIGNLPKNLVLTSKHFSFPTAGLGGKLDDWV